MLDVHEEERDQSGFDGSDAEGDGGIEAEPGPESRHNGEAGAGQQREPDGEVTLAAATIC